MHSRCYKSWGTAENADLQRAWFCTQRRKETLTNSLWIREMSVKRRFMEERVLQRPKGRHPRGVTVTPWIMSHCVSGGMGDREVWWSEPSSRTGKKRERSAPAPILSDAIGLQGLCATEVLSLSETWWLVLIIPAFGSAVQNIRSSRHT